MQMTHEEVLEKAYSIASRNHNSGLRGNVSHSVKYYIDTILSKGEQFKGVINVSITSLVEKIVNPLQDIRRHQVKMVGGYSGRTLDTKIVAPFLRSKKLMSMVESGWLTRSLEQDHPYDLEYPGAIRDTNVKSAFLHLIDNIQSSSSNENLATLVYFLEGLIIIREENKVVIQKISTGDDVTINQIINLLENHFEQCMEAGKARLPVLAFYAIYEILIKEVGRYKTKKLQPLGSHTSADLRSGDIGDIQINNADGTPFEGVEIKYGRKITFDIVEHAIDKIKPTSAERYYILSTDTIQREDEEKINNIIDEIKEEHGCQIIINGLVATIKYYLRLISDDSEFLNNYIELVKEDPVVKKEHKDVLKKLMEDMNVD